MSKHSDIRTMLEVMAKEQDLSKQALAVADKLHELGYELDGPIGDNGDMLTLMMGNGTTDLSITVFGEGE